MFYDASSLVAEVWTEEFRDFISGMNTVTDANKRAAQYRQNMEGLKDLALEAISKLELAGIYAKHNDLDAVENQVRTGLALKQNVTDTYNKKPR